MAYIKPILLVEDSPYDVELMLAALEASRLANEIVICRDGVEALDFLQRRGQHQNRGGRDPAVVLLDLKLPKIDGLEVLAAIRSNPETQAIPVVMLTSSREQIDILRSYKLGVNAFIVKPMGFKEYFEAVQDVGAFWAVLNEPPSAQANNPQLKAESTCGN